MVVPMKKVSLVCLKEEKDALLLSLQKSGELMLIPPEDSPPPPEGEAQQRCRQSEELLKRIKPYREKKGFFSNRPEVEISTFLEKKQEAEELRAKLSGLLQRLSSLQSGVSAGESEASLLLPWTGLDARVEDLAGGYTAFLSGWLPIKDTQEASRAISEAGGAPQLLGQGSDGTACVILCCREDRAAVLSAAKDFGFAETALPVSSGSVSEAYNKATLRVKEQRAEIEAVQEEIRSLSKEAEALELLAEQYYAESERTSAPVSQTEETVYIEGWVRSDRVKKLEQAVRSVTDAYALELRDPLPEETPPTATKNNRFVTQFETITDMFSRPRYGDLDPNPVMAPWYWIIFGMMMGDVGYGAMMVIALLAFKLIKKPRGEMGKLVNVLFYSSFTTIVFGILFGSYFGETWHPILFGPLENPIGMLMLSLGIGVLHIFTGLILKIVDQVRSGHALDAVFDQVSWMLVIGGLVFAFLDAILSLFGLEIGGWELMRMVGLGAAILGAAIILFTAGRAKKGFGKVTGGLLGLYDVTSYLSDILSYARIMALGLATGVIGMVMNILAGLVRDVPVAGIIFALLIYVVGHVFNLAMSLLSAYVHDSRLQYIEFYNKFYEGGGEPFRPLSIRTQYVDVVKNKTENK